MRSSPLKRTTPLKRKPIKKKVSAKTLCNKADELAAKACKACNECQAKGWSGGGKVIQCSGRLEWAHLKSRSHKTIRHDPLNSMCLCWSHHNFFTCHPDLWTKFCEEVRPGVWDRLNALLQEGLKPDYSYWIDYYKRVSS